MITYRFNVRNPSVQCGIILAHLRPEALDMSPLPALDQWE